MDDSCLKLPLRCLYIFVGSINGASELLPLAFSDGTFAAGGPFGPRAIEDGNWLSLGKRNGGGEGDHARRDSGAARRNPRLALTCGGAQVG